MQKNISVKNTLFSSRVDETFCRLFTREISPVFNLKYTLLNQITEELVNSHLNCHEKMVLTLSPITTGVRNKLDRMSDYDVGQMGQWIIQEKNKKQEPPTKKHPKRR